MTRRDRVRLVGLVSTIAGCAAMLAATPLPAPPMDRRSLLDWPADIGPTAAALGIVRVVALAAALLTLATTLVGIAARAARFSRVAAACDCLTLPAVRRVLDRVAAGSIAAVVVVAPAHAGAAEGPPPTPILRSLDTPPPTLRRLEPAPEPREPLPPQASAPTPQPTVVVQSGESFWTIAERVLSERNGRQPTTGEVDDYWRRLVEKNLDRLAVRGQPDLIFTGQEFVLP